MADKYFSTDAPRKMKFMPKIPPKKEPKIFIPKSEPVDDTSNDVIDAKLLNLAKQKAEQGSVRIKAERKTLGAQVAFGHVDTKSASRFSMYRTVRKDQDGDTKMGVKEYKEPWNYDSYYPAVLPMRLPYSGDPDVLNEEEFGKGKGEYDEAQLNAAEDLGLMDDYEDGSSNQMLFFQFPAMFPLGKRSTTATKGPAEGKRGGPQERCVRLEELPPGYMGKLLVYRSGAVKMKLGDHLFDVTQGMDCFFPQDVMTINHKEKHCCLVGELRKRAVVTPDLGSMLENNVDAALSGP